MSAYLSLFPDDNFWTVWPIDLIFGIEVGHHNIYVKFEYQGHRSKVKVMATKKLKFLFLAGNFQTNWPTDLIVGMEVGHHNI